MRDVHESRHAPIRVCSCTSWPTRPVGMSNCVTNHAYKALPLRCAGCLTTPKNVRRSLVLSEEEEEGEAEARQQPAWIRSFCLPLMKRRW